MGMPADCVSTSSLIISSLVTSYPQATAVHTCGSIYRVLPKHKTSQVFMFSFAHLRAAPQLLRFMCFNATYQPSCSDWPLDTLDIPQDPAAQRLNSWQEQHARLILQQVPGLQDLRFVLCPK